MNASAEQKPLWEVVDHNGDVAFPADWIAAEPCVAGGLYTPREWAKRLAKENTDPEAPAPLQARKLAKATGAAS